MGAFLVKGALFLFIVLQVAVAIPVGNTTETNSGDTLLKRSKRTPTLINTFPSFDAIKNGFVDKHNSLRSAVSPSASDMREISWDDELEQLAKDYSANCIFGHSSGLSTSTFSQVGESIHRGLISPTSIPDQVTQLWYDEVSDYTYTDNSCAEGKACGHYLQVVWAKSYKIGCGISACETLIENVPTPDFPYQTGEPCSACDEGLICRNNSLCYSNATEPTTTTSTTTTTTPMPTTTTTTTTTPMTTTTTTTAALLNATLISATSTQGSSTNVTTGADQQTSSAEPTTGTAAVFWQQSSAVTMLLVTSVGAIFCLLEDFTNVLF